MIGATFAYVESSQRIAGETNVRRKSREIGLRAFTSNRSDVPNVPANVGGISQKMHTLNFQRRIRRTLDIGGISAIIAHNRPCFGNIGLRCPRNPANVPNARTTLNRSDVPRWNPTSAKSRDKSSYVRLRAGGSTYFDVGPTFAKGA